MADIPGTTNQAGREKRRARVRWKGTAFVWSHDVTTSALGVGADYQSTSHQVYTQGYGLILNYYLIDTPRLKWRIATTPGMDVELTDSNETTSQRELVVRDLPLTSVMIQSLHTNREKLLATALLGNFTAIVPTSKYTRGAGHILTLSPRLTLLQNVPLAGKGAGFLESVLLGAGVRYDALFSEANVGVSEQVSDIPRQSGAGRNPQDPLTGTDVLGGARMAPHTLRASAFAFFTEELGSMPINFVLAATYASAQLAEASESTIALPTGDVSVEPSGRAARPTAGWSGALTLFPLTELGVSLGYTNSADLDSETPDFFYTPSASFNAALVVSIDAIYERMTGPPREVPFILF